LRTCDYLFDYLPPIYDFLTTLNNKEKITEPQKNILEIINRNEKDLKLSLSYCKDISADFLVNLDFFERDECTVFYGYEKLNKLMLHLKEMNEITDILNFGTNFLYLILNIYHNEEEEILRKYKGLTCDALIKLRNT
jgi:hypothetical protein